MSQAEGAFVRLSPKARLVFDPVRQQPMLLYPERGLSLNEVAHAIVLLCDGRHDRVQIAQQIAARFAAAPADAIRSDVDRFLDELARRGLVQEGK